MRTLRQPQRTVLVTDVGVARDGRDLGRMTPSLNLYPSASEPIGTPSIRTSPLRDLYASVVGVEQDGERATFRFFLNPGVTWLWVGGAVMVLGGLLAVWPARRRPAAPPAAVPPRRDAGSRPWWIEDDRHRADRAPPARAAAGPASPHRRALPLAVVVVAVALAAWLLSAGLRRDPAAIRSPLLGRARPGLRPAHPRRGPHGAPRRPAGQVVVVNFWASWCAECRVEHPALSAAWARFRDAGVVLVGVDFQDDHPSALAYLAETGTSWPVVADPGSRTALAYGVYGIPETFVIGPDGRVAAKHIGPMTYDQLVREITRLLPGGAGGTGRPAAGSR